MVNPKKYGIDYDPRSDITKKFFATVQNKLHYAVHEHTVAELIHERVDKERVTKRFWFNDRVFTI